MRLTVLGGSGAWPAAGGACSGYLVETDGFRLLVDPGYGTVPRLLELLPDTGDAAPDDAVPDLARDADLLRRRAGTDRPQASAYSPIVNTRPAWGLTRREGQASRTSAVTGR